MKRLSILILALAIIGMGSACSEEKNISSFFTKDKGNVEVTIQSCAGAICSSIIAGKDGKYWDVQSFTVRVNGDYNKFITVAYPGVKIVNSIEVRPGEEYTFKMNKSKAPTSVVITEIENGNTIPITQFTTASL
jgi:hypothetical protein